MPRLYLPAHRALVRILATSGVASVTSAGSVRTSYPRTPSSRTRACRCMSWRPSVWTAFADIVPSSTNPAFSATRHDGVFDTDGVPTDVAPVLQMPSCDGEHRASCDPGLPHLGQDPVGQLAFLPID